MEEGDGQWERWEDKNLLTKWSQFNHFYNPAAPVHTLWRKTSNVRVAVLWDEVVAAARKNDLPRAFDRVGHLVHHIQDMGSPPHVVPVNHGLTDGFERLPIDEFLATAQGVPLPDLNGSAAHQALAIDTLRTVNSAGPRLPNGAIIPWSAYWRGEAGKFGSYGAVGNSFGAPAVKWASTQVAVPTSEYRAFLRGRVEATLGYTRAFLRWAAQEIDRIRRSVLAR